MRTYICSGFEREYEVEAQTNVSARWKAAKLFAEEHKREEPIGFLFYFFEARLKDPQKPGVKKAPLPIIGGSQ